MAGAAQGGAEAFFERLALALGRAGVEQRVAIRRDARRAAVLREGGVDAIELPFGGWLDFATRPALKRAIAAFRPQVVLTWMNRASGLCPRSSDALPFVQVGRLGGYYDLKYYRRCRHLIANTEDIRRHIVEQGWPRERAHYLPNFVQATRVAPVARASLATAGDTFAILALGRLHRNKGFDVLLRALVDLPRAVLWLAGAGPEEGALKALARELGVAERVRFLGWRDDVAALFAACDLFACSSRHEPLGNVVIEAWAQDRPVVAAAAAGPAALIRDGESGLLTPVDDASALAAAIRRAMNDPDLRRRLAAGGRSAYERDFTEAAVVGKYRAFFDQVAGGR
ncbi:MAG: glycosyltransferase [Alphaproteobacteria bacterium]|nr:glycosyltransferase [Alphaproteobacteria bacterium]